jgi:hypothetical protein
MVDQPPGIHQAALDIFLFQPGGSWVLRTDEKKRGINSFSRKFSPLLSLL